jgi:hypothetical protein
MKRIDLSNKTQSEKSDPKPTGPIEAVGYAIGGGLVVSLGVLALVAVWWAILQLLQDMSII